MISNKERQELAEKLRKYVSMFSHASIRRLGHTTVKANELLAELFGYKYYKRPSEAIDEIDSTDVLKLADLIDRPTCVMDDLGNFTPHHDFKRMVCSECGAMYWEPPQETLRMRYCPHCGAEVIRDEY